MSATRRFRIAAIPADGVGREVVAAGRTVLDALAAGSGGAFAFDWQEFGWGCEYFARTGRMMAEDGLTVLKEFDAIYFGAVGWPAKVPDHVSLWGSLIKFRRDFDQYVNLRPVKLMPGIPCPLAGRKPGDIDYYVVRENTEGEYSSVGGRMFEGTEREFVGRDALVAQKQAGVARRLVGFEMVDRGIARHGYPARTKAGDGVVTSGTHSPTLNKPIGLALLPSGASDPGTEFEVEIRGRATRARIVAVDVLEYLRIDDPIGAVAVLVVALIILAIVLAIIYFVRRT